MNLDEIVTKVAADSGIKPGELKKAVDGVFRAIKSAVEGGEKVVIGGVGSFVLKSRDAGEKLNEKTGEKRMVEAASFLAFKPIKKSDKTKKNKADKKAKE